MTEFSNKAAILDYWRAVELFSPQNVPRVAPNDSAEPVFSTRKDVPLPWDPVHRLKSHRTPPFKSRRFQVYCGIYRLKKRRPLAYADLLRETKRIAQDLGVPELSENCEVRIRAGFIASSKQYSADTQDFLNSFFVKDLGKVAAAVRTKNMGKGLWTFLAGDNELDLSKRIDLRQSMGTLFQYLSPALFPPGRWPSKDHHPLVFSQQFAVNAMVHDLMQGAGLFAINGPPGTGKTTLLRDVIAAVVVERAMRLAELTRPEDAFAGEERWKVGEYTRVISTWKRAFKGFEIVVASNNNGAVENVTLEVPVKDAVDPSWLELTNYFSEFATRLINQPAWAMVAAPLGNQKNRDTFMERFWYGDKKAEDAEAGDPSASGFRNLLRTLEGQPIDWRQAVSRFKNALAHERRLRDERLRVHRMYLDLFNLREELSVLDMKLKDLTAGRESAFPQLQAAQANERKLTDELDEAQKRRLAHRRFRPGILEILCSLGQAFREWRGKDKALETLIEQAERQLTEGRHQAAARQQEVASFDQNIQQTTAVMEQKRLRLAAAHEELYTAQEHLGASFPLADTWDKEVEARELSSPWADPAWNEARAKVFLEALQLHKAFIAANADAMRKSLHGAMDVLAGDVPETAPPEGVEAAWTTLFFVVPVISTTFASFDRLFAHLGRESVGWLLIDEAGQAVPQAAAGAIWRAKRSVVVGDPLQLEPVVTIPLTVQQALRRHYQVDDTWLPGRTSVQQLTDRVSVLGTYLNRLEGPLWVGSPLRVHRRCDRPMFDISNNIAYDSLMVFGSPPRRATGLPPSGWMHMARTECEGHWIPAEGKVVEALIADLMRQGVSTGGHLSHVAVPGSSEATPADRQPFRHQIRNHSHGARKRVRRGHPCSGRRPASPTGQTMGLEAAEPTQRCRESCEATALCDRQSGGLEAVSIFQRLRGDPAAMERCWFCDSLTPSQNRPNRGGVKQTVSVVVKKLLPRAGQIRIRSISSRVMASLVRS